MDELSCMNCQYSFFLVKIRKNTLKCYQYHFYKVKTGQKMQSLETVVSLVYAILFPILFINACVVGTYLNCMFLLRQFNEYQQHDHL